MPQSLLPIIASVVGGVAQVSAASKAAHAQSKAASQDLAFQKQVYGDTVQRFDPFYKTGTNALAGYNYEMGLGAKPTGYAGFQATPGYAFRVQQGNDSVNALAGARGGLNSGATMQALQERGMGLASQEYGNYLSRLGGMVDMGSSAASNQAAAGTNAAAGVSNALSAKANAIGAGAIGVGNAINGTVGNLMGLYQYQKMLQANGGGA